MRKVTILAMILTLAVAVQAQTTVADFEGGVNNGDWTFGFGDIEPAGGNPDGWFHTVGLDTYYPIFRCEYGAVGFTGDFVADGVTRISADFQCVASNNEYIGQYPITVLLRNDMGTPGDVEDDIFVYPYAWDNVCPDIGAGWSHYEFDIPSNFVGGPGELPAGWYGGSYWTGNASFPEDALWQDVLAGIGRVEFWWNDPDYSAIFANFEVGADNIIIEREGSVAVQEKTLSSVKALFE